MMEQTEHAALMAVAHALTAFERASLRGRASRRWPKLDGAEVADVLEMTVDRDMFLDQTEPFYERFTDQTPEHEGGCATLYALHALVLLDRELTPARLISLLQRAGVVEAPRYPGIEVGLLAHDGAQAVQKIPDANSLLLMARAEQGMRAEGIPENVITEFRSSVRRTKVPGFSRNAADIARWVTFTDRYTELPRKVYDPLDDIAVILAGLADLPLSAQQLRAEANLRSHLDMRAPETIKSSLAPFFTSMSRAAARDMLGGDA